MSLAAQSSVSNSDPKAQSARQARHHTWHAIFSRDHIKEETARDNSQNILICGQKIPRNREKITGSVCGHEVFSTYTYQSMLLELVFAPYDGLWQDNWQMRCDQTQYGNGVKTIASCAHTRSHLLAYASTVTLVQHHLPQSLITSHIIIIIRSSNSTTHLCAHTHSQANMHARMHTRQSTSSL